MPRPRSAPDWYLLSKVSTLYYLRRQTQQQIAERLDISRPKVSRLLQEAQERGIVQIIVSPPQGLYLGLEARLEDCFQLSEAQVIGVEPGQPAEVLRRQLGAAAASYLARTLQPGQTIGMAWGTTLSAMVQAVSPTAVPDTRVIQTLGGIGPPEADAYAADVARRLAQLLGAAAVLLPAPGVLGTTAARDALRQDPHVQVVFQELEDLDAVYVGIGSLRSNPVLADGVSLPAGTYAELESAGAVGDLALRFFDAEGTLVRTSLDDRILGISAEQLRGAKRVVAVAGGAEKHSAIFSALKTGIIDVLITDQETAETLISWHQ